MDGAGVIALLEKVAEAYEGREVTLVMDNARYQRNRAVLKRAEELGIAILFIPPYSPNLNLIERLWRMVKGELRKRSWRDFDEFKRTIDGLVDSTTGENRERVETLIGEKVQLLVHTGFWGYTAPGNTWWILKPSSLAGGALLTGGGPVGAIACAP